MTREGVRAAVHPARVQGLIVALACAVGALLVLAQRSTMIVAGIATAATLALVLRGLLLPLGDAEDRRDAARGLWAAFAIRVVVALGLHATLAMVGWRGYEGLFFDDEPYYDGSAWAIARGWRGDVAGVAEQALYPFTYFVAAVYTLFGHEPAIARVFNAAVASVIAPAAYHVCRALFPESRRTARVAMWIVVLSPDVVLWSVALMRDIQMALAMIVLLHAVVAMESRPATVPRYGIVGLLALVFNILSRRVLGWVQLALLAVYAVTGVVRRRQPALAGKVAIMAGLLLIAVGAHFVVDQFGYAPASLDEAIAFVQQQYVENERYLDRYYGGEARYALSQVSADPTALWPMLVLLARGTFQPSPWWAITVGDGSSLLMFLPGVAWYVLTPFWVIGAVLVLRHRTGVLLALLGVTTFVIGTTGWSAALEPIRARVPVLPLLYVMAALGLVRWREGAIGQWGRLWLVGYVGAVSAWSLHYLVWSAHGSMVTMAGSVTLGLAASLTLWWSTLARYGRAVSGAP